MLTGLEYFKNLEELDLTGHVTLRTIPIFPEKLRRFACGECDLEELPMFNDSLRMINIQIMIIFVVSNIFDHI